MNWREKEKVEDSNRRKGRIGTGDVRNGRATPQRIGEKGA